MKKLKLDHLYYYTDSREKAYIIRFLETKLIRYYKISTGQIGDVFVDYHKDAAFSHIREATKREQAKALLAGL